MELYWMLFELKLVVVFTGLMRMELFAFEFFLEK
jgi:hypothetical protein